MLITVIYLESSYLFIINSTIYFHKLKNNFGKQNFHSFSEECINFYKHF